MFKKVWPVEMIKKVWLTGILRKITQSLQKPKSRKMIFFHGKAPQKSQVIPIDLLLSEMLFWLPAKASCQETELSARVGTGQCLLD